MVWSQFALIPPTYVHTSRRAFLQFQQQVKIFPLSTPGDGHTTGGLLTHTLKQFARLFRLLDTTFGDPLASDGELKGGRGEEANDLPIHAERRHTTFNVANVTCNVC